MKTNRTLKVAVGRRLRRAASVDATEDTQAGLPAGPLPWHVRPGGSLRPMGGRAAPSRLSSRPGRPRRRHPLARSTQEPSARPQPVKLSVFTPLPPAPTGIADYSFGLLRELSSASGRLDRGGHLPSAIGRRFVSDPSAVIFRARRAGARHVPTSATASITTSCTRPSSSIWGVVVLHDLELHHARLDAYVRSPAVRAYRADIGNPEKRRAALEPYSPSAAPGGTTPSPTC